MKAFFDIVRAELFSGSLKQEQVDGLNCLLAATENLPKNQRAYIFATAYHETARTMQPIEERGKGKGRDYGTWRVNSKNQKYCPKMRGGDVYTFDECPHLFYGRGFVQLTWYDNYLRAGKELGQDFINNPDWVMQPDFSAKILVCGMMKGWFTGKRLSDVVNERMTDFVNARRVVNGTDKAELISSYARIFLKAFQAA